MKNHLRKISVICLLTGIMVNLSGQEHWTILNKPTPNRLSKLHFLDSLRGWAAGNKGTILKTTDGGQNWTFQNSGIGNNIIELFMLDAQLGWALAHVFPAGADTIFGTILLNTTDGGGTWEQDFFQDDFFNTIKFLDTQTGWMGGEFGRLFATTNGGRNWFEAAVDPGPGAQFTIYHFKFFSRQYGFAMGGHFDIAGVVWQTTNGGQRWTPKVVGPEPLYGMHFQDSLNIIAIGGDLDFGSGMVRSSDGGATWEYVYLGIFGQARALSFRNTSEAWAPLGFTGTYMYSLNGGNSWTDIYTPDSSAIYDLVFTDSLTGYAVGDSGTVLKYISPTVAIGGNLPTVPRALQLYQNYPNPFNPSTDLGFRIADLGFVNLEIFDINGRRIITLVDKYLPPGDYEVRWDGRDEAGREVSSGLYIYRLKAGRFEQHRKMLLIR
jgi:hypothetical protein